MKALKMTKGKSGKKAAGKRTSPGTKRSAPKLQSAPPPHSDPDDEAVRLRAYFIAENRHRADFPGDADADWVEARRQLIEEAADRS